MGFRQGLTTLVTTIFIWSCASAPPPSDRVPPFERVAFVTPEDLPELTLDESKSEFIDKTIYPSAALGTVGGAAIRRASLLASGQVHGHVH